ncbi:ubiquitin thioesterase OTU1-like [Daphnia carinata]|uniref:ubiquitin thioesterase OTU1-like n=1 Tax=Daphnia carinata TaxID=120202 RepID=UPI002580AAEC|nr:ubiquitin thioesterase OTU1-like [Daphnia carinata]XP_059351431.1 ubiquitin thioesterase OTU1-like [Daphnia carinata]
MASKMQLRVKHKGGQSVISTLTLTSRVDQLLDELSKSTQIPVHLVKILRGFPPIALDISDKSVSLGDCGLQERDTLLVEELPVVQSSECLPSAHSEGGAELLKDAPTGILMRKVVPSDNSCLFTSIGFCLSGKPDPTSSSFMRELVASTVVSQTEQYNEALLGKPNKEYKKWILQDDSWRGAIELAILSSYFGLEIDVVNTQHSLINKFGEDQNYGQRILLIYDGIHYDPLYLEPFDGSSNKTLFPTTDTSVLQQAEELAAEARASHQFTDVNHFTLKCMVCHCFLTGQTQAQQHAKETGHTNFGEVTSSS